MQNINVFIICTDNLEYKNDSIAVLNDYFSYHKMPITYINNISYNPKNAKPSWIKTVAYRYIDNKDFMLCWDLDLLPKDRSVNIMNFLNMDKINMCIDTSVLLNGNKTYKTFKYNGGLLGYPYSYKDFFENIYNKYAPGTLPSYEQYYLNNELNYQKIQVNELPNTFNTLYTNHKIFHDSFCKHYTWRIKNRFHKAELIAEHKIKYFQNIQTKLHSRQDLLKIVPKNITMAELGVFKGEFSKEINKIVKPKKLYLVDIFSGRMGSGNQDGENMTFVNLGDIYKQLQSDFKQNHNIELCKSTTHNFLSKIPNDTLDAVYIDADHSYSSTKNDLVLSYNKVRNGGYIMGHDYCVTRFPGVYNAVNEFCQNHKQHIKYITNDKLPSYCIELIK